MPNTRRGLWKAINRRGKDVVSTSSAASTVEESVSCGTFGSTSKRAVTHQGDPHLSNTELQEFRSELVNKASAATLSGPVDAIIIQPRPDPRLVHDGLGDEKSYQYCLAEDDQLRLSVQRFYQGPVDVDDLGPVDVDAYIQDDTSTSTTSEERQEILAIKRRLQSRHASKVPRQIVLCDYDEHESSLAGYDDGFGTLFDDVYHTSNSYPFDEAARDKCTENLSSKSQSRTDSYYGNIRTSNLGRTEVPKHTTATERRRAFAHHTVSSRPPPPYVFEC